MLYAVFGIMAIYGLFAFVQPERYPIPLLGSAGTAVAGLVMMIAGAGILLYLKG